MKNKNALPIGPNVQPPHSRTENRYPHSAADPFEKPVRHPANTAAKEFPTSLGRMNFLCPLADYPQFPTRSGRG
ncbi:MAG: hypothetical protein FWE15_07215 [Actinomycetia bacterium]|nr:hypothetical protein [Actinomycetes bacterium]